ncbi:hypothetical protein V6N13_001744 [Hibiscus sabdariffa]|uniref:ENTH domain-containing protein n=1 Tax=Hibiscus sabdariffa TaxID=183260 RepID=A0ABR2G9Y7_9ROSI
MGYRTRLRAVFGLLKDKASLIKTTLSTKRHKASARRVVLRATSHGSSAPPSDHRIDAVIAFGQSSPASACTCIQAVMDRLHRTRNSTVALKCLYTIHNIIGKGSFILKDQLTTYPSFGGRNFINLSTFRDDSDPKASEMSAWVRWYAGMLEQNLSVSRMLGYHLNSPPRPKKERIMGLSNSDLLKEIDLLINFPHHISAVPDSLYLQRESLVYEVVRLVSEDYRLDGCKERISLLLVNRNRNDVFWDSIKETKANLVATVEKEKEGNMVSLSGPNCFVPLPKAYLD